MYGTRLWNTLWARYEADKPIADWILNSAGQFNSSEDAREKLTMAMLSLLSMTEHDLNDPILIRYMVNGYDHCGRFND